jgi:hypothetical protein
MSNAVFWGLTNKDFENVLWNGVTWLAVGYAGKAVGAIVAIASEKILLPNRINLDNGSDGIKILACKAVAIGAGIAASVSVSNRLPFVAIAGQTALKSFVIGMGVSFVGYFVSRSIGVVSIAFGIPGWVPACGALGYFGPWILYLPAVSNSWNASMDPDQYFKDPSSFIYT